MNNSKIKIVSRESSLARTQAKLVGISIKEKFPKIKIIYNTIKSTGDIDQEKDITQSDSEGIFTSEISLSIEKGINDIAVHSWKDVPIKPSKSTQIFGTLKRADQRDMLFIKKSSLKDLKRKKISILTSSPRRIYNSKKVLPKLLPFSNCIINTSPIRGNMETRLKKFLNNEIDGIIIAKAAFDRMLANKKIFDFEFEKLFHESNWLLLPLSIFPTAPGQGALALETNNSNDHSIMLIKAINDKTCFNQVSREKEILNCYGGGCHQKIGVTIWKNNGLEYTSYSGETMDGEKISSFKISNQAPNNNYKNIDPAKLFPLDPEKTVSIKRNAINKNKEISMIKNSFIYLSRKNAIQSSPIIHRSNIIWTSGLKCWYAAVKAGYWINGSSEGLGEKNNIKLDFIMSNKIDKYKISHNKAKSNSMKIISVYEIDKIKINEQIENKSHFFWMSPLIYNAVHNYNPNIINGFHACGPGKTYEFLLTKIKDRSKIQRFISFKEWRDKISENK